MASTSSQVIHNQPFSTVHVDLLRAGLHVGQSIERLTAEWEVGGSIPARGGTWVFFGWVCAAQDSKLAPRSGKNFP